MSTVTAPFLVAALATIPALGQESSIGLEDVAFLELSSPRTTYFEHESFRLTLSFGLEREFLQAQVVQLFSRELDLPVQVDAPWLEELTGAVRRSSEEQDGTEPALTTFVLNGEIAEAEHGADRERNGRAFVVIELEGNMLAGQAGELVVPAGSLRFAYATRFEPDLFGTRVPADRQLAVVAGDPLRLSIEPLPLAGRPDGFTNAVGRFSVNASADPRALVVGGALQLVLRIEGEGNFEVLEVPPLELDGFHVLGRVEETGPGTRTVTYDLTPLTSEIRELPPIRFAYFDPSEPPGYRVAESRSIPLEIAPDPEAPEAPSTRSSEASDPERETQPKAAPTRIWVLALALLVALATGLWWLRRRARSEADPSAERARGAAAAFRAGLERGGTDPGEVYAAYLAARLNCAPAAVISPDLARVLVGRGASADLAARAARALDELVAARYGGRSRVERHALAALVDELDPVFDERPRR